MTLQIFHLKAHQDQGYDEFQAFVIVAKSDGQARRIAGAKAADERLGDPKEHAVRRNFWNDPKRSRCQPLGTYTGPDEAPHIILSDYKRG